MNLKYKHGGGYKKAALEEGLNWKNVTDYSTSINRKATEFYPENMIYLHQENMEYPDKEYSALKELIEDVHHIPYKYFLLTNGANEAISGLFHMFLLMEYNKEKSVVLVGSTYLEYEKHTRLNKFDCDYVGINDFTSNSNDYSDKIVVIVNPNTPTGQYYPIKNQLEDILKQGAIVIIDESFIEFTDKPSILELVPNYPNLYIIHSMTKFYGSPGARLGLLISSNDMLNGLLKDLLPLWSISAYDNWFYKKMIIQYKKIKKETVKWIESVNLELEEILANSKNLKYPEKSITNYHTLELSTDFIEKQNIQDLQRYFLKTYNIYVRSTANFYGCSEYSFRVGLRLSEDNIALFKALREIG